MYFFPNFNTILVWLVVFNLGCLCLYTYHTIFLLPLIICLQELAKLSRKFEDNVLDATKKFEKLITDKKDIEGLPNTALGLAAQTAVSKVSGLPLSDIVQVGFSDCVIYIFALSML